MLTIQNNETGETTQMTLEEVMAFINNDEARSNDWWEDYSESEIEDGLDFYNHKLIS